MHAHTRRTIACYELWVVILCTSKRNIFLSSLFHFACSITVYTNATINYSNQITLIIKCVCARVCNCGVLVSNLHFYFQQKQREFFIEKQRNINTHRTHIFDMKKKLYACKTLLTIFLLKNPIKIITNAMSQLNLSLSVDRVQTQVKPMK